MRSGTGASATRRGNSRRACALIRDGFAVGEETDNMVSKGMGHTLKAMINDKDELCLNIDEACGLILHKCMRW